MDVVINQLHGAVCVYCGEKAFKVVMPAVMEPEPEPELELEPIMPAVMELEPELEPIMPAVMEPEPELVKTITDLRVMYKSDLVELADSLGLDIEGNKEDIVLRIANELGIEY
jgi:hypothetical protein